jgi:serine/threonine protein kinase
MFSEKEKVGSGVYGSVYKKILRKNTKDEKTVAVKVLRVPKETDFIFSISELDTNKRLAHDNISSIIGIYETKEDGLFDNIADDLRYDDIYLIYEIAKYDLLRACDEIEITEEILKKISAQLLSGLEYMHLNGYIHGDIKPENILCYENNNIKISDFGLTKIYHLYADHPSIISSYFFRAPEVFFPDDIFPNKYDFMADVWSAGCVIYYISSKKYVPLAEKEIEENADAEIHLENIIRGIYYKIKLKGLKIDNSIRQISKTNFYFDCKVINNIDLYDSFLMKMLQFDKSKRFSCSDILSDKYISEYAGKNRNVNKIHTLRCDVLINIPDQSYRNILIGPCSKIYLECRNLNWYSDIILFTSISIWDALLCIDENLISLLQRDLLIYFKSCFYISAKYYLSETMSYLHYKDLPMTEYSPSSLKKAKDIEDYILNAMDYMVYRPSIYDLYLNNRKPEYYTVFGLLLFVLHGRHARLSLADAYNKWISRENSYIKRAKNYQYSF